MKLARPTPRSEWVRALVLLAMLLASGCGSERPGGDAAVPTAAPGTSLQISSVTPGTSENEVDLHVLGTPDSDESDPCFERYDVEVHESDAEIVVEVFRVVEADYNQGGCANVDRVVPATLERAAGARVIVDAHDGRRFARGPDGYSTPAACGIEETSCAGVGSTTALPAACTAESYRYAVTAEIDGGHYSISNERCDGRWAAFDVDFGSDACLPEADKDDPCRGVRMHRTFWRNDAGRWRVLSYQGSGDCAEAQAAEPNFPGEICES